MGRSGKAARGLLLLVGLCGVGCASVKRPGPSLGSDNIRRMLAEHDDAQRAELYVITEAGGARFKLSFCLHIGDPELWEQWDVHLTGIEHIEIPEEEQKLDL